MIYIYTPLTPKYVFKWTGFVFLLNIFFAFYFGTLHNIFPYQYYLVYNQLNGLAPLTFIGFAMIFLSKVKPATRLLVTLAAGTVGALAGVALVFTVLHITGPSTDMLFRSTFVFNIIIVYLITGFIYYWEAVADTRSRLQNEQNRRLDMEKQVAQTRINLIQARIEPRFIFNALSQVLEVIDVDLPRARAMQLALIRYLRLSLSKFGTECHSIGQETEMIRSYLDIYKTRFAEQFDYIIDIPEKMNTVSIPSMLVHSLIEKIVDPPQTNRVTICGETQNGQVAFKVSAQGVFPSGNSRVENSLKAVGEQIHKLFGNTGRLMIDRQAPDELSAKITIPGPVAPLETGNAA